MTAKRVLLLTAGSVFTLVALALLAGGGALIWVDTKRDDDGFFMTSTERFETTSFALASEDLDAASDAPDWLFGSGRFGDVRLTGSSAGAAQEVFIGIGDHDAITAYLEGVEQDVVTDVDFDPFRATYRREAGAAEPGAPGAETFWEASVQGSGTQTLEWEVEKGTWAAVVMNADASPNVEVDLAVGANIGFVLGLGIGFVAGGAVLLLGGIALIYFGARKPPGDRPVDTEAIGPAATTGARVRDGGEATESPAHASDGDPETPGVPDPYPPKSEREAR